MRDCASGPEDEPDEKDLPRASTRHGRMAPSPKKPPRLMVSHTACAQAQDRQCKTFDPSKLSLWKPPSSSFPMHIPYPAWGVAAVSGVCRDKGPLGPVQPCRLSCCSLVCNVHDDADDSTSLPEFVVVCSQLDIFFLNFFFFWDRRFFRGGGGGEGGRDFIPAAPPYSVPALSAIFAMYAPAAYTYADGR